jgi:predicted component of type VI protein secretion system
MTIKQSNPISLRYRLTHENTYDFHQGDYIDDIKHEIEALLNTEAAIALWPKSLDQLEQSCLNYGLPHAMRWMSAQSYITGDVLPHLASYLEKNEPRLKDCVISLDDEYPSGTRLRLSIQGRVRINHGDALLVFKSHTHPLQMRFHVS